MPPEFELNWKISEEEVPGGLNVGAAPKSYTEFRDMFDAANAVRKIDDLRELRISHYPNFSPFEYQREAVLRMLGRFRGKGIFGDQVGLGKTVEVGMTVAEFAERGAIKNVLLLCPDRLVLQWSEEIEEKFSTHFSGEVIEGLDEIAEKRDGKKADGVTMYIMSFAKIRNYIMGLKSRLKADIASKDKQIARDKFSIEKPADYGERLRELVRLNALYDAFTDELDETALTVFDMYSESANVSMIVVDEADALLSANPNKTLQIYSIVEHLSAKIPYRILLSATPIRRQLNDVYKLIKIVRPSQFADKRDFIDNYCFKKERLSDFLSQSDASGENKELSKLKGIIDQLFTRNRLAGANVRRSLKALTISEALKIDYANFSDERVPEFVRDAVMQGLLCGESSVARSALKEMFGIYSSTDMQSPNYWGRYVHEVFISADKNSRPFEISDEKNRVFAETLKKSLDGIEGAEVKALRFALDDFVIPPKTGHLILYHGSDEAYEDVVIERQKRSALKEMGIESYENFKRENYLCEGKFTEFDLLVNGLLKNEKVVVFSDTDSARNLFMQICGDRALSAKGDGKNENYFRFKTDGDEYANAVYFAVNGQEKGVNMQFCSKLIIANLPHDANLVEQIVGRISRINQKNEMNIYVFAEEGSLEHYLYKFYNETLGLFSDWDGDITFIIGGAVSMFLDAHPEINETLSKRLGRSRDEDGELAEIGFSQIVEFLYSQFSGGYYGGKFDSYPPYKEFIAYVEKSKEDFARLIKGFDVQEQYERAWQDI